jgi:magnesium-protoporphyrin O-methyltransferase
VTCCGGFSAAVDAQFTPKKALSELERYRKKGPGVTTRLLRDGLTKAGLEAGTILDVGAGIGALTFELLARGATSAVAVDASAAYLAAAREEAGRRGRSELIRFVHGDFVERSTELAQADTVTLDRVVCCYAHYQPLLDRALSLAVHGFALSYPRDRWFVRAGERFENTLRQLRSNPFRTVVHPVGAMQRMISDAGFALVNHSQTRTWAADVYARRQPTARV